MCTKLLGAGQLPPCLVSLAPQVTVAACSPIWLSAYASSHNKVSSIVYSNFPFLTNTRSLVGTYNIGFCVFDTIFKFSIIRAAVLLFSPCFCYILCQILQNQIVALSFDKKLYFMEFLYQFAFSCLYIHSSL